MRISRGLVRFLVEGCFLVGVAAALSQLVTSWLAIVVVMAAAFLLAVAADRYATQREERGEPLLPRRARAPRPEPQREPEPARSAHVEVLEPEQPAGEEPEPKPAPEPEPEPVPAPVAAADPEPEPAAIPGPEPVEAAEPTRSRGWLGRRARPEEPAAPPAPVEAAPAPSAQAAEPAPAATAVLPPLGVSARPREWNVWELERLARDGAGVDAARDEERGFLLMHLREFAGPDGLLPLSFDPLVRESFAELLGGNGGA